MDRPELVSMAMDRSSGVIINKIKTNQGYIEFKTRIYRSDSGVTGIDIDVDFQKFLMNLMPENPNIVEEIMKKSIDLYDDKDNKSIISM